MSTQTYRTVARRRRPSFGRWVAQVGWKYPFAALVIAYAIFPLLYVLSTSVSQLGTLTGSTTLFSSFSTKSYEAVLETSFVDWAINTLVIGAATALGTVLMAASAAYVFSRYDFKGRRTALTTLLVVQMFPQMLAFISIYLLLYALGNVVPVLGLDSALALICVYLGGALGANTFLIYGFFNTVPREIDEAAKIDGASHAQIYWRIILRLVTPILVVVAVLSFMAAFGDFILARIILVQESNWTLAVGMYAWVSDQLNANWGMFAAGAVIAATPILLMFVFLQRYIVGGLTSGALKG